jgi:type IV pilus assembly protein PilE
MKRNGVKQGFTLMELMIAVAIVGIITAIAYPSYQAVIKKGYRATAQADLLGLAASLERYYSVNFSYSGAASGGADTGSPAIFSAYSPATESATSKKYTLTIYAVTDSGNSYEIRGVPVSGGPVASDGTLYYFSDGRKAWDQNNNGSLSSDEYCWSC